MLSTLFKLAIATLITNQLAKTSHATHLYAKTTSTRVFVQIVANDGATTIKKICPVNSKKCNKCGIIGHFAGKCRKPQTSQRQTPKPPQTNVNQIDNTAEKSDDEESVIYIIRYQQLYEQIYDSNYDSDYDNYIAAISMQFGEVQANAMIDSGSVVSLIKKTIANRILRTSPSATWITTKERSESKTFSNELIKVLGHLEATVSYNN